MDDGIKPSSVWKSETETGIADFLTASKGVASSSRMLIWLMATKPSFFAASAAAYFTAYAGFASRLTPAKGFAKLSLRERDPEYWRGLGPLRSVRIPSLFLIHGEKSTIFSPAVNDPASGKPRENRTVFQFPCLYHRIESIISYLAFAAPGPQNPLIRRWHGLC